MEHSSTLYVRLNVHKESIVVAYVSDAKMPRCCTSVPSGPASPLDKLIRWLHSKSAQLVFVYEAGPCGYWLYRYLPPLLGDGPSLIPKKPGDKVKTTRRDAVQLACLMRSGDFAGSISPRSRTRPSEISPGLGRTPSGRSQPPSTGSGLPAAPGYPLRREGELGAGTSSLARRGGLSH
jgi:hypothetical protein